MIIIINWTVYNRWFLSKAVWGQGTDVNRFHMGLWGLPSANRCRCLLCSGWPSRHTVTPALSLWPESPESPTCCRLTETIAVTQRAPLFRDGCLVFRPLVPGHWGLQPAPQSPPSPGKNPAGWVGKAPPTGRLRSGAWN